MIEIAPPKEITKKQQLINDQWLINNSYKWHILDIILLIEFQKNKIYNK